MSPKAIFAARPGTFKFSDRVVDLEVPCKIGRAFKNDKSESTNGYFDCKVLSKAHALLLCEDGKFFLLDTGSSNGTFVNNIRLSRAGQESGLTEVFTGDILRFGSDVVDKTKKTTQKCVVLRIQLFGVDGSEIDPRSSQSRLFRPSDSYEDVSIVTSDLQNSLGREKALEDKLIGIKNIVMKHSNTSDFSAFILEMRDVVENMPGDMQPSKILHDEQRLDRILKENRALVLKCKELDIKLDSKDGHCSRLQEKVTKDANHIHSLGSIIDRLRVDIGGLQKTINSVKDTQERVREEYEETLMKQRNIFDEEIVELSEGMRDEAIKAHRKAEEEKWKLEAQVSGLKEKLEASSGSNCWSTCSSLASLALSPPATPMMRSESAATERSAASSVSSVRTIIHSLNKIVNLKGEVDITDLKEELQGDEEFDLSHDLESSLELFNGMLRSKDDEITHLKLTLHEVNRDVELLRVKENNFNEMQAVATDEAETICRLEKRNFDLHEAMEKQRKKLEREIEKLKRAVENTKKEGDLLKILANELHKEIESKDEYIKEINTQLVEVKDDVVKLEEANGRLKGQAISKWVDAAEADFDSMFQEEFALLRGSREVSRSVRDISRQSSEQHTAASTPYPQDLPMQDVEERPNDPTPTPEPKQQNMLMQGFTAAPKLKGWQWMVIAFLTLLPALFYKLAYKN